MRQYIRLTVWIKQHFGVPKLYYWFVEENVLATKQVQKNDLGLIFGVPGSEWRSVPFSFRREFRFCEDLVIVRIYRFLLVQNDLSQDKFGWWTTSQSNSWYYKWFLMHPQVKTGTKPNAGFNWHLFEYFCKISIYFPARCCLINTVNSMTAFLPHWASGRCHCHSPRA